MFHVEHPRPQAPIDTRPPASATGQSVSSARDEAM